MLRLGAGSETDGAACDTSTGIASCQGACVSSKTKVISLLVQNDGSADNALVTGEINKAVLLFDDGLSRLVSNGLAEVTNMTVFSIVVLRAVISAIRVVVSRGGSASIAKVTKRVHMEAVLARRHTPDVTGELSLISRVLNKVDDTSDVGLLLGVLEGALGVDDLGWSVVGVGAALNHVTIGGESDLGHNMCNMLVTVRDMSHDRLGLASNTLNNLVAGGGGHFVRAVTSMGEVKRGAGLRGKSFPLDVSGEGCCGDASGGDFLHFDFCCLLIIRLLLARKI